MRLHYFANVGENQKIYLSILKGVIKSASIFPIGFRTKTASLCKGWRGRLDGESVSRCVGFGFKRDREKAWVWDLTFVSLTMRV